MKALCASGKERLHIFHRKLYVYRFFEGNMNKIAIKKWGEKTYWWMQTIYREVRLGSKLKRRIHTTTWELPHSKSFNFVQTTFLILGSFEIDVQFKLIIEGIITFYDQIFLSFPSSQNDSISFIISIPSQVSICACKRTRWVW